MKCNCLQASAWLKEKDIVREGEATRLGDLNPGQSLSRRDGERYRAEPIKEDNMDNNIGNCTDYNH